MGAITPGETAGLPTIQLATVRLGGNSTWSRQEIYDDELAPDPFLGQESRDSTATEG